MIPDAWKAYAKHATLTFIGAVVPGVDPTAQEREEIHREKDDVDTEINQNRKAMVKSMTRMRDVLSERNRKLSKEPN